MDRLRLFPLLDRSLVRSSARVRTPPPRAARRLRVHHTGRHAVAAPAVAQPADNPRLGAGGLSAAGLLAVRPLLPSPVPAHRTAPAGGSTPCCSSASRLRRAAARAPRLVASWFEATYLLAYPFVPVGFGVFLALGHRDRADEFWMAALTAGFVCYGTLPWVQTRPPRALAADRPLWMPHSSLRRLNTTVPAADERAGEHLPQRSRRDCGGGRPDHRLRRCSRYRRPDSCSWRPASSPRRCSPATTTRSIRCSV